MPSSLAMVRPSASACSAGPPASVCGTGARPLPSGFSRRPRGTGSLIRFPARPALRGVGFPSPRRGLADRHVQKPARPLRRVPASVVTRPRGAGMSTCRPSGTPLGLPLGPDCPWVDQPSPGDLGHSAPGIPSPASLLVPASSLPRAPPALAAPASPPAGSSPTDPGSTTVPPLRLRA